MQIRLVSTGAIRNCSEDVGRTMIAAGLATELSQKEVIDLNTKKGANGLPYHDLNWSAQDGQQVMHLGDLCQYAPALVWRCQTCAQITYAHPTDKLAAKTCFHFQSQECPDDVYDAYLKLFEAWSKKGNRKLQGVYESLIAAARQRTKDGMDDRGGRPRNGEVVTL